MFRQPQSAVKRCYKPFTSLGLAMRVRQFQSYNVNEYLKQIQNKIRLAAFQSVRGSAFKFRMNIVHKKPMPVIYSKQYWKQSEQ